VFSKNNVCRTFAFFQNNQTAVDGHVKLLSFDSKFHIQLGSQDFRSHSTCSQLLGFTLTMMKRPAAAFKRPAAACKRPAAAVAPQLDQLSTAGPVQATPVLPVKDAKPDWYDEPDDKARLSNYLVTAAKLLNDADVIADPPLRDPAGITKAEFHAALMDSLANPVAVGNVGGRPRTAKVELDSYVGVREGPEDEGQHHHAGLHFHEQKHSFLPFKQAMRERHGIATHWSTSHVKFWSIVRYVHCTTEHKKVVDRDPFIWTRDNRKLNLFKESQEPFQAAAWTAKREGLLSEPFEQKAGKKKGFNKLDFNALVLSENLMTPSAVLAHVFQKGSKDMQLWTSIRQRRLKEFIQDAVDQAAAKDKAALERETEWQLIERLAKQDSCECGECGCLWWALAVEFFKNNKGIDRERLAACLRRVIVRGPAKDAPVPLIIGAKNCAKSTMFDPIRKVFGEKQVGTKPKLGAPNGAYKELIEGVLRFLLWDDYRPVEYAATPRDNPTVPVTEFLALFQGQPLKPQVSQSFNDGHPSVRWCKGAAMTAKAEGLWEPQGNVTLEEVSHMKARVEIFTATYVVGKKPEDFAISPMCPGPWCRWLILDSMAFAARQGPSSMPTLGNRLRPLALPPMPGAPNTPRLGLSDATKRKIEEKRQDAIATKRRKEMEKNLLEEDDAFEDPWAGEPL
jgi:hypothetical protein